MSDMKDKVWAETEDLDFEGKKYQIDFQTNFGKISVAMEPDEAPNHCRSMIGLARLGFYDGLTFHRVVPGFVIQGGCPQGTGTGGPGYELDAEFNNKKHEPGVLSMARAQDPNSAGSQFFLCLGDCGFLNGQYTVFGRTKDEDSLNVVQSIGEVETDPRERPTNEVKIENATVQEI